MYPFICLYAKYPQKFTYNGFVFPMNLISLYWILSKSHARQFCNLSKNDHWEVFQVSAYYLGHEDP